MKTFSNISLRDYNTFGIDVRARKLISVETTEELKKVLKGSYAEELFILGGGSNMLLTQDIDKTVLHINLKGKKVLKRTQEAVYVEAMAGENWHEFVMWCISKGFGGLENLSLIPGNVGTAPIQNIGAYGVEIKDSFESCKVIDIQTLEWKDFTLSDCNFGYRDSIFKSALKDRYIITSVVLCLSRQNHRLNTSYGSIDTYLEEKGFDTPGIKEVSDAVIHIRRSKLPDPKELGNSGSFFKNPVIPEEDFRRLEKEFTKIPFYKISEDSYKIPAGWLIDQAGLKGFRQGDAGVHKKQALVLVNHGNASGKEILALARTVQKEVRKLFQIELQPEVNIF